MLTMGESIKKAREDRSLSRTALSNKSGVLPSTIRAWEHDITNPTIMNIWAVADALDMSIDELIGRTIG